MKTILFLLIPFVLRGAEKPADRDWEFYFQAEAKALAARIAEISAVTQGNEENEARAKADRMAAEREAGQIVARLQASCEKDKHPGIGLDGHGACIETPKAITKP